MVSSFLTPMIRSARVCRVLMRLRRRADIGRMKQTEGPREIAEMAIVSSGRHLALAAAFLPDESRTEGIVAFLLCRVLDAYEDLSPSPEYAISGLRQSVRFLAGVEKTPPPEAELKPRSESDEVECLLASRLEWLRQLLRDLPQFAQARLLQLVSRMAAAMEFSLQERSVGRTPDFEAYCDGVLGDAVGYAFHLLTKQEPYNRGRRAAGRLLHIANNIRDLEQDHVWGRNPSEGAVEQVRNELALQAVKETPHVPQLLFNARFPTYSGSRGALAIIVATTTSFYLRQGRGLVPRSFLQPVWIGLSCTLSANAYCKLIRRLEATIIDSLSLGEPSELAPGSKRARPTPLGKRTGYSQQVFEYQLALRYPSHIGAEALAAAARLLHFSQDIFQTLPRASLGKEMNDSNAGPKLVAGDLFVISAAAGLSVLGNDVIRQFGELVVRLALHSAVSDTDGDCNGETAVFLSLVASQDAGIDSKSAERLAAQHRRISQQLYASDRQSFWNRRFFRFAGSVSQEATP